MSEQLLITSLIRCQECGGTYSTKQELTLHMNMTHNDKREEIMGNLNQSDSD